MKLSKEAIRRMVGQHSSRGSVSISGSGGGGGVTTLAGLTDVQIGTLADGQALMYDGTAQKWINGPVITDMATKTWVTSQDNALKEWVGNNYISIAYFGRLFQAFFGDTAVNPNDTSSDIDGIMAMYGFWSDKYISTLGQNDAGGSGGGGGEGTVTSVAFSAPTGFEVSGSPVTSSGTIALTFAAGYSLPTTAKQTAWDNKQDAISDLTTIRSNASHGQTAYGWGNHADAGYLKTEQYVGTVTRVAFSAPTGFKVSGSPVTSSGTIALTFANGYSLPTTAQQTAWSNKQDAIVDLATIRSNATKGATAYGWGNHANYNYATQSWVEQQGYASESWVDDNYISIAYFSRLFQAFFGDTAVNPNDTSSDIDGIMAMYGFWSDKYISTLGQNDAGGSGGGGDGTVTSVALAVPRGFVVTGSPITESGTLAISFAAGYSLPTTAQQTTWSNKQDAISDLTTIRSNATKGATAYSWGNHANYNYATQSWVQQQGYLTEHQSLDGYLPLSGGTMTGDLHLGSSAGTSPYIYFGDSSYVYIVEDVDDHLTIRGAKGVNFIVGSNYNITINSANIATQSWVQQQGYLTEHQSLVGYATQSWVQQQGYTTQQWVQQQGYLTSHQSVDGTFWGQSWSNHGSVSGSLTGVGSITSNTNGTINNFSSIELLPTSGAGNGGALYFHYDGITSYASSYITEDASGILSVQGYGTTGLVVGDANNDYIQIGAVRLVYDSQYNAIKVVDRDNGAAGLYATGFMSALGMSKGVTAIDRMSFNSLNIGSAGTLKYNNNDFNISSNTGDMYLSSDNNLYLVSSSDVIFSDCNLSVNEGTASMFRVNIEDYEVLLGGDPGEMAIKIFYRTRYYTLNVAAAINLGILS